MQHEVCAVFLFCFVGILFVFYWFIWGLMVAFVLINGDFIVKNNIKMSYVAYCFLLIEVALSARQKIYCIILTT